VILRQTMTDKTLTIGAYPELGKRTYLMGIINITPDSFSGDGLAARMTSSSRAVEQAGRFLSEGADIARCRRRIDPARRPACFGEDQEKRRVARSSAPSPAAFPMPCSRSTPTRPPSPNRRWRRVRTSSTMFGAARRPANGIPGRPLERAGCPDAQSQQTQRRQVEARLGGRYVGVEYADLVADVRRELMESVALGPRGRSCR
jgi:dihydropteroate synthase